jgi:hypothetical protein
LLYPGVIVVVNVVGIGVGGVIVVIGGGGGGDGGDDDVQVFVTFIINNMLEIRRQSVPA